MHDLLEVSFYAFFIWFSSLISENCHVTWPSLSFICFALRKADFILDVRSVNACKYKVILIKLLISAMENYIHIIQSVCIMQASVRLERNWIILLKPVWLIFVSF